MRLARQPSVFKVLAVSYSEPVLLETLLQPPVAVEQVLASAKDFHNADSCYRLETWWDLWQYQADWELSPSRVALCCLGPQFDHLPAAARGARQAAVSRRAHHDPGTVAAEQVV